MKIGDKIRIHFTNSSFDREPLTEDYMFCQVAPNKGLFISLVTGNRWSDQLIESKYCQVPDDFNLEEYIGLVGYVHRVELL